jgi:glycosyltransferase involved in cell wall biosynthesis
MPGRFPYSLVNVLPSGLRRRIERELRKRYYEGIDEKLVEVFPFFEIVREGFERLFWGYGGDRGIYIGNQIHDWYVSGRIGELRPDIVIGYETSALRTFRMAKGLNFITVLDLAQVHYRFIELLRYRYPEFESIFADKGIIGRINGLKDEELRYTDYIIALSTFAEETLIAEGIPRDKIYLLNLGFDPLQFSPKETYRKEGVFKVLYVGTVTKRKGINLLLEACRQLDLRDIEVTVIGEISDAREVLKRYEGGYRYVSYLNHGELASYYRDADVFVLPSYLDSWGMVVIEAMACGTPVIVSENTGAKDAVVDGVNGFIVPVDDVEALKKRILYLHDNRERLESLGRNARKQAEKYTWENYRKRIRETVLEIWERSNTPLTIRSGFTRVKGLNT